MMKGLLQIMGIVGCTLAPLHALEPKAAGQVERLVKQLADEQFAQREEAGRQLQAMLDKDQELLEILRKYEDHENPEIRERVAILISDACTHLELVWQDPGDAPQVRSVNRPTKRVELVMKNRSPNTVRLFWVDWDGVRQDRRVFPAGKEHTFERTYPGHVWLVTNLKGEPLGLYVVGQEDAQILFRGTEREKKAGAKR